ncbi:MAG: hypothetical protein K1X67_25605 [Fimbriimonadaceae bacterium]|nr:hypothetical protein [Fimbriimonadaceae bacterium]
MDKRDRSIKRQAIAKEVLLWSAWVWLVLNAYIFGPDSGSVERTSVFAFYLVKTHSPEEARGVADDLSLSRDFRWSHSAIEIASVAIPFLLATVYASWFLNSVRREIQPSWISAVLSFLFAIALAYALEGLAIVVPKSSLREAAMRTFLALIVLFVALILFRCIWRVTRTTDGGAVPR